MRVAILIRKWSTRAGNERVAVELARYLAGRGHEVTAWVQRTDPSAEGVLPPERVKKLEGPSFDPTLAMLSFAWATKGLVERLREARAVDVVVGFNHSVVQDVYRLGGGTQAEFLALTARRKKARGGPILDTAALVLEQLRFKGGRFEMLVAPSERVKDELARHYQVDPARVAVVWNGIDLARFRPAKGDADPERIATREAWGVLPDEPLLLFVGQDPVRKGLDIAIDVAQRAGVRLVYVGNAPRPSRTPRGVIWDGERKDIEACYRAADALIAPSWYDPFGGAILEALASGIPAVATDRIGATERTRGTPLEALLVEEPDDVEGLVARVRAALDPSRRTELRAAAVAATRDADRKRWGAAMESVLEAAARMRSESPKPQGK